MQGSAAPRGVRTHAPGKVHDSILILEETNLKLFDNISGLSIIGGGMAKLGPNKKAIEKARAEGDVKTGRDSKSLPDLVEPYRRTHAGRYPRHPRGKSPQAWSGRFHRQSSVLRGYSDFFVYRKKSSGRVHRQG